MTRVSRPIQCLFSWLDATRCLAFSSWSILPTGPFHLVIYLSFFVNLILINHPHGAVCIFQMILIRFSLYLLTLHDNELWFSEIMVSWALMHHWSSQSILLCSGGGAADIIQDRARPLLLLLQTGETLWKAGRLLNWIEFSFFSVGRGAESLRGTSSARIWQQNWISQHNQHPPPVGFSTIKFYTYFKFSPNCPSIQTLIRNCCCRSPKLLVYRFNVHQEVVLAGLYNLYSFRLAPIFFYTYAVFALQVFVTSASTVSIKTDIVLYSFPPGGLSECLVPYKVTQKWACNPNTIILGNLTMITKYKIQNIKYNKIQNMKYNKIQNTIKYKIQ